jgi:transposase-like protein
MISPEGTFGMQNFGSIDLGDRRRTRRLVAAVDDLCRHPGGTLPDKLSVPRELRAFYRLMNRPEVTHAVLMGSHADRTRRRIAAVDPDAVVLILHDATELDYTTKETLCPYLGQIGAGTHRGYICHNSLAVRADTGAALGLTSQILHHRANVSKKETAKQKRLRASRESRLWVQGVRDSGAAPVGTRCVDVSDSLSDTFEYLSYEITHGRAFVLRSREDRRLARPLAGEGYLYAAAQALPSRLQRELRVQKSPGRSARLTTVQVAWAEVLLAPPGKRSGEYDQTPLAMWAVRVWEENTPADEERLEWLLLTNVPVESESDAHERLDWYERRSIIEELHKGMKTGCAIEKMKFEKIERLEPAIAVLSVVSTMLLNLRDAARAPGSDKRPATEVVDVEYVEVLARHYGSRLGGSPTIWSFYMHVARLGGHQNRKGDGFPGWLTLWRGWTKLQAMVNGYRAAHRTTRQKCGIN